MTDFTVTDMTCGGCANSIKRAVTLVDPQAVIKVNMANKRVQVTGTKAETAEKAIREAGFNPVRVE